MEIKHEYDRHNVVVLNVGQDDVDGMLINWDLSDSGQYEFMEKEFIEAIMTYLPEYAMGYETESISSTHIVDYIRESAKTIIKIKKIDTIKKYLDEGISYENWDDEILKIYNNKGIFSELILHFLLREMKNSVPLISKIYFKDSNAVEAHGFDAVHVLQDKLCLGETKFYGNGKQGIKALIDDLNKHFKHDYLKEQFLIISKSIKGNHPLRDKWIKALSTANRLEDKFKIVYIPLLCIYEDVIATDFLNELNSQGNAEDIYFDHVQKMKEYFDSNNTFPNRDKIQPILILLPVQSKDKIVATMLKKIYNMQNI